MIKIWSQAHGAWRCVETLQGHHGFVLGLATLPDGRLISCDDSGSVWSWHEDRVGFVGTGIIDQPEAVTAPLWDVVALAEDKLVLASGNRCVYALEDWSSALTATTTFG